MLRSAITGECYQCCSLFQLTHVVSQCYVALADLCHQLILPLFVVEQDSLETWPSVNIMSSTTPGTCEACFKGSGLKLAIFYGQPYNNTTLKPREPLDEDTAPMKNYNLCESCARTCQTYNTICHRKHDYYGKCKATVTNIRVSQPSKNTTTILRELLGNDVWITEVGRCRLS